MKRKPENGAPDNAGSGAVEGEGQEMLKRQEFWRIIVLRRTRVTLTGREVRGFVLPGRSVARVIVA